MINRISIVVAVYNAEKTISNFLDSYLNIEYQNKELIIINNKSQDDTELIISKYSCVDYYINEHDIGIFDAWNKGVKLATGDWICFVGADDILLPNCFIDLLNTINCNDVNFVSAKINLINKSSVHTVGEMYDKSKILYYQNFAHIGSITKKKFLIDNGLFDTNFKIAGDYDFYLRNRTKIKSSFSNNIICISCYGVSQTSFKVFKENLKIWNKHNIHNKFVRYFLFLKNAFFYILKIII